MDMQTSQSMMSEFREFYLLSRMMKANWEGQATSGDSFGGQGLLLFLLYKFGTLPQKDLASKMEIRPASLCELARKCEEKGLVEKRKDSKDQRITNLQLTEAGREIAAQLMEERKNKFKAIFDGLSEEEQETLLQLLKKVNHHLAKSCQ